MMDDINFLNGFKAECVHNGLNNDYTVRVYYRGLMVTGRPLKQPSDYEEVAKALVTGYINGMYEGKKDIINKVKEALREYI